VAFESPNCKNLVVGASNFHIDPTHRSPVFPETAQFVLEIHGFERVELKYLSPVEATPFESTNREATVLNEMLYGPQDFAVIGYKSVPR
jgi:O-antigen chain-terminating methyltransferase